jgi:hypothetical protein
MENKPLIQRAKTNFHKNWPFENGNFPYNLFVWISFLLAKKGKFRRRRRKYSPVPSNSQVPTGREMMPNCVCSTQHKKHPNGITSIWGSERKLKKLASLNKLLLLFHLKMASKCCIPGHFLPDHFPSFYGQIPFFLPPLTLGYPILLCVQNANVGMKRMLSREDKEGRNEHNARAPRLIQ